ncbi:PepSY domain-containing protein [Bordetella avium]|nr:PepSY domain-containing protein [Bordetella avium]WQE32048.1 PepSY domain-containing protein [Bordetella avium]
MIYPLHTGELGGVAGQGLVALLGLARWASAASGYGGADAA